MTATSTSPSTSPSTSTDALRDELRAWLSENWDPDLTVAQWWERLGLSGWAAPMLPTHAYGKGLTRNDAVLVANEIGDFGALGAPTGLGMLLAAPTITTHGTAEQVERYVRDVVTGQRAWCQLFSEPGAGSDLARVERDGDEWVINGQKVWTSGGQVADLGMLIARTNPDAPKHQGISYFAFDMHQPGVDVRPLREMTGRALFNEVFLTDARVAADAVIGDVNNGWAVANTTLMFERAGLSSGGGHAGATATPGTVVGDLHRRAGDFVSGRIRRNAANGAQFGAGAGLLIDLAKRNGMAADATVRQDLVRLHTINELGRFNNLRVKAAREAGRDIPGMPNIGKLSMSNLVRLQRDLGLRIAGAAGMLHSYDDGGREAIAEATGNPLLGVVTELALFAQAPPIYGGTDQVQKNIIGERVLGLPKEPGIDATTPFSKLPKNG
jgi:alkylation response protein AidB-like acyl-CoA dehydrogenase